MAKTLAQLRSQLQVEVRDPNDKIWPTSTKNQYINSAYFQIQKDNNFQWRWNIANTTLSSPYALPSDFVIMDNVLRNDTIIYVADKRWLRQTYKDLTTTGNAIYYYYESGNLKFYPVDTSDMTVDYRKKLTALSDDSDTIAFPDDFADAIVKYAKYLAWSSPRGNRKSAEEALVDYNQAYSTIIGAYGLNDMGDLTFGLSRPHSVYRDNAIT